MDKEQKHTGQWIIIILLILIILGGLFSVYKYEKNDKTSMENIFGNIQDTSANLIEYIVYGTHLNLKRRNKR